MRPQVVIANSASYYFFIRVMRLGLRWFSGGRGMGKIHRILSRVISTSTMNIGVRLAEDSLFFMPASDSYWGSYLLEGLDYEPEFHHVLKGIADIDYDFIDAGANYGYWSVLAGSKHFGGHRCLAIEASPMTFALLEANRLANDCRFACINCAVSDKSNERMWLRQNESHAATRVERADSSSTSGPLVESITLDDAIRRYRGSFPNRLVIKLDVEGGERQALDGAKLALESCDVLVLFECHASDKTCCNIALMLNAGFSIAFVTDDGITMPVRDIHEGFAVKQAEQRGYNFLAVQPKESSLFFKVVQRWISDGRVTTITSS